MFLVQERMFGVWVTLDEGEDLDIARDLLARIRDKHLPPTDGSTGQPRYRIHQERSRERQH